MGFFPAESRLTLVKGAKLNVSFLEISKSAFSLRPKLKALKRLCKKRIDSPVSVPVVEFWLT